VQRPLRKRFNVDLFRARLGDLLRSLWWNDTEVRLRSPERNFHLHQRVRRR